MSDNKKESAAPAVEQTPEQAAATAAEKRKFITKYTLLYGLCLTFSLGVGFALAAVMNDSLLDDIFVWIALVVLLAFSVGWILASVMWKRWGKPVYKKK